MGASEHRLKQPTDDDLMIGIARGDKEALGLLMNRYQDRALRYCYRWTGDYHLAEDMSQEGFIKLYKSARKYRPEGKFMPFFYKILTNLCLDAPKKISNRPLSSNNPGLDDSYAKSHAFSPIQALESDETQKLLRQAIDNLSPKHRQAVILRELEGMKYNEIAAVMGCPINDVKVWLHRGKKQLTEILKSKRLRD